MLDILFNPLFWLILSIGLVVLEIFAPGYVFVGLAGGASVCTFATFIFGNALRDAPAGEGIILVLFAAFALLHWYGLRKLLGVRQGQSKTFDHDINEGDG